MSDMDYTRKFSVNLNKDEEIRAILSSVYNSLRSEERRVGKECRL